MIQTNVGTRGAGLEVAEPFGVGGVALCRVAV